MFYSENQERGFRRLTQFLPFVFVPLTLLSENLDKNKILKLIRYFGYYIVVILSILLILQVLFYGPFFNLEHGAFLKLKITNFYFSAFIYMAILVFLFDLKKNAFKIHLNYVFILFLTVCLILLSARIAIFILFVCLAIFFYSTFNSVSKKKRILVLLLSLSLLTFASYQVPQIKTKVNIALKTADFDFKTILTKNQITITRNSLEYRIIINYCGFLILKDNILGVGLGDNEDVLYRKYQEINFKAGIKEKYNFHNQYMEELTKHGLIGGVIFITLILYSILVGFKKKQYLFYVSLYIMLVCLVESYLNRQHGIMFTAFFLPLFYNLEKRSKDE